jgi:hypothetical protein
MKVTLTVPDELASQFDLQSMDAEQLAQLFERALRRRNGVRGAEFEGLTDVLEVLAGLPTPEEVLALQPSANLQQRIDGLLEKNRKSGLSPEEEGWWEQYEYVEHLMRVAKAKAATKLRTT